MKYTSSDIVSDQNQPHPYYGTINAGDHHIYIGYETDPMNPFEDWDTEPPLIAGVYGHGGYVHIDRYNSDDLQHTIVDKITDGQVIFHAGNIVKYLGYSSRDEFYEDYMIGNAAYLTKEEKIEALRQSMSSYDPNSMSPLRDWFEFLEYLCKLAKIPCLQYTARGYSQGDCSDLFIALTPEWFELTGAPRNKAKATLKVTGELYEAWAFGDVFWFEVLEFDEDNGDDYTVESRGSFYGRDLDTNGLMDAVNEVMDSICEAIVEETVMDYITGKFTKIEKKQYLKSQSCPSCGNDVLDHSWSTIDRAVVHTSCADCGSRWDEVLPSCRYSKCNH